MDSWPELLGLVWESVANWRYTTFIKLTLTLWRKTRSLIEVTHAQGTCTRNFQTQPTNQTAQFWSRASVQVSGTSFLSVCHSYNVLRRRKCFRFLPSNSNRVELLLFICHQIKFRLHLTLLVNNSHTWLTDMSAATFTHWFSSKNIVNCKAFSGRTLNANVTCKDNVVRLGNSYTGWFTTSPMITIVGPKKNRKKINVSLRNLAFWSAFSW